MKRNTKKQMKLFLELRTINNALERINKNIMSIEQRKDNRWNNRLEHDKKASKKWNEIKEKIYSDWSSITTENIEEFPYLHKEEIDEY